MYTDEFLKHYGRRGMKWGQHIYGKERMVSRKSKRNFDDHETIFRSLNDSQRRFLTGTADDFYNANYADYYGALYKQKLIKIGKTPMSFVDAWYQRDNDVEIAIATNSKYQGKGYGRKILTAMLTDLATDKNIKDIWYMPNVNNKSSNALATSVGFELLDTITNNKNQSFNRYHYKKG